jgi:hypothetical protein
MTVRSPVLPLVCLCGLAVLFGGLSTGAMPEATDGGTPVDDEQYGIPVQGGELDQVVMDITLRPDGSADWRIEHRIRLDSEAATAGFDQTRDRIETDRESFRANFTERVRAMATTAERDTGRTMVVENISVDAQREQLPREYGIIGYEFRWYGFAETADGLRAGDALDGLFLDEQTTLLVNWPANTTLATVSPAPDDRRDTAVVWEGPFEFAAGEPTVALESGSVSFGPDLAWSVSGGDVLLTLGVALFVVVGLVGTGGLALRRRRGGDEAPGDEGAPEETPTAGSGESTDDGTATTDEAESNGSEPPEELLSNEERVLALLDEAGGRIKQQDVVEETGWSETKTSEVVSDLRESDRIAVYRLGRNNVIALPETGLGYDTDNESGDSKQNDGETRGERS